METKSYPRLAQWSRFEQQVKLHIEQYTQAQYANPSGDEQVDSFSIEDCWTNVMRYYNRRNSCTRGNKERIRDVIKVAHYMQFIHEKLLVELGEEEIYQVR